MKILRLIVTGMVFFIASALQAQFSVSVHVNAPPPWGPVGYSQVQYYYLPDVEAYYDVPSSMFIYYTGGVWVHRAYLPSQYRNYDLYNGYKVVMTDYHGNAPYTHFKDHKMKYGKGYHGYYQRTIGDRPGNGHPGSKGYHDDDHYNNHDYYGGNGHNGKDNGHGNDKNKKEGHEGGKGKK
jgi:hypothetical protein